MLHVMLQVPSAGTLYIGGVPPPPFVAPMDSNNIIGCFDKPVSSLC